VKALFAQCGKLVLPPLNDMEILAHFLDGRTEDMAIEILNISVEGKSILMSQVEGARTCI
jgi:hypothetical protein